MDSRLRGNDMNLGDTMKQLLKFSIFLLTIILLVSCSSITPTDKLPGNYSNLRETWASQINTDPKIWMKNADHWFLTGEWNADEQRVIHEVRTIPVSAFRQIEIAGNFKVEILGGQKENCIIIYGPKSEANQVIVNKYPDRIIVRQAAEGSLPKIIVRIGVKNLSNLTHSGNGLIVGRDIESSKLTVNSHALGSTYLSGHMNLREVNNMGDGTITLMGVESPSVYLKVIGAGNVNLYGNIGIQNIIHNGNGCVQIIGANSKALSIYAYGDGLTTVAGLVKLRAVTACNNSRVLVNCARSHEISVIERNTAFVGIAGVTNIVNVDIADHACFQGGRLVAHDAYVRALGFSEANVGADRKIFAEGRDFSRIYYFGDTNVSAFPSKDARILRLGAFMPQGVCQK